MKWWNRFTVLFLALSVGVNILLIFRLFDDRKQTMQLAERLRTAMTPDPCGGGWGLSADVDRPANTLYLLRNLSRGVE